MLSNNYYGYPAWQWASIFSISVSFCLFGFASSMLTGKGRKFRERNTNSIALMLMFSSITGMLIVAVFAGGILQGTIFPNFSGDIENFGFNSWVALKFRGQDWFKLAIWAYIAGFYERFLPNVFDKMITESQSKK